MYTDETFRKLESADKVLKNLIPVSRFNDYYKYPTVGAIRQYIFNNRDNFRNLVIIYCGNRQYVDVLALVQWLKTNSLNKT